MASKNDLEANAEFIRLADSFVEVPEGKNCFNYANVELIVDIAKKEKVDCVWPGWGHASEQPPLPRALAEAGITFLGPTAPVMHALGDKIASTILAQSSKVPCIPWNGDLITAEIQADGSIPQEPFKKACLQTLEEAKACAARIGYPVVLKASEGGGGKGIRKCQNDEELKVGWEQVTAEVVGSPIFMMQLCTGARHLEVQLVGDEYGECVALIGRDCSTQRRFQKIFEEGPPTVADKDDFREAERAAQRLAMSVGYRGAGTVEYLYKPETKGFYFLELNPRLQVEHPVTEGITGVNVPALQLQIGMGIPLNRVPDIRRFYGLNPDETSKIDFIKDKYVYPTNHVIAARVTAENPDDAFRPTSGKIERIRFQSTPSVWGYFSIGANGGIHEFADSQFGHIFASGPTREHARKNLQLALKRTSITGEIRNPTEYLVELAETEEFKQNTIDTAWLDALIAQKSVKMKYNANDMIFYGACLKAHLHVKEAKKKILDGIQKGHMPLQNSLKALQAFQLEIAHDSVKYNWQVARTSPHTFAMTIGETTLVAQLREQPDGSVYVKCENLMAQISGVEEPLCLRLRVDGKATITFPKIRDPSELRSDFNGKLVRYLHADGTDIKEGEAFVELEAMKMIMSLRASVAGKVHHTLGPGSIVGAGDLLATLDLADPSKVTLVKPFAGCFVLSSGVGSDSPRQASLVRQISEVMDLLHVKSVTDMMSDYLSGYHESPKLKEQGGAGFVQHIFKNAQDSGDPTAALSTCSKLLGVFVENEQIFASLVGGDETQLIKRFTGTPEELLSKILAHNVFKEASNIVSAVLRSLTENLAPEGFITTLPQDLSQRLKDIENLPDSGGYAQVKLLAHQLLGRINKPLNMQVGDLRKILTETSRENLGQVAGLIQGTEAGDKSSYFGADIVSTFLGDADASIRNKASELYILRTHRGFTLHDINLVETKGVGLCGLLWTFSPRGALDIKKKGFAIVLPNVDAYDSLKKSLASVLPEVPEISTVHILVASTPSAEKSPEKQEEAIQQLMKQSSDMMLAVAPALDAKKCVAANVLLAREAKPLYLNFDKEAGWKEIPEYRNMRQTLPFLIELPQVQSEFTLQTLQHGRLFAVDLGVSKDKKTEVVFGRGATHRALSGDNFQATMLNDLLVSCDLMEKALLDPLLEKKLPQAQIFIHCSQPIVGTTEKDTAHLQQLFRQCVQDLIAQMGARVLRMRISKIELKVWVSTATPMPLRLVASSSMGWDTEVFQEILDPQSGTPTSYKNVETQATLSIREMLSPHEATQLNLKRESVRKSGSTYIYDFPALLRISLMKLWRNSGSAAPAKLVTAKELVLEGSEFVQREQNGKNTVGMVVWLCTLHTPEYPDGRDVIMIGNDMTIKSGSFGTVEDEVFQKASALARAKGIPRVHIACNSGARIGCVEELKSILQIAWVDKNDLMKGFEYLFISDADFAKLPSDSVDSHLITVNGEKRHVLDAIIGANLPSTKGGIGVECLQGSGLIAGETSRAYEETFTLSYVTGRSVGIGAYLNRLGQRNIQMVHGPMILTGSEALNKLLGQQIYTSLDQTGGPHIMVPNGVTHELVRNDQDGVDAILRWLSYVPKNNVSIPPMLASAKDCDVNRKIAFTPTKSPYDPRHMLAGVKVDGVWQSGFCDEGSFHEYLEGWGKTVVVGRGRLGGMPVGIIAVETRTVEKHIPADPQEPNSHDIIETQAGQVWYPDSAYKTAQAIRDFNRGENLPLIIFANWRGFSGGTRDMFGEVLKYGSMIVDALVDYKHPVTIYIPPSGELRGGAWVVLDPKINDEQIEMYADVEGRGGILEPPGAAEIVFKKDKHTVEMMHRCDEQLQQLDARLAKGESVQKEIQAREKLLLPVYQQVSREYCDLHDKAPRMKSLGAIKEGLQWADSRSYLHWRIRRRVQENHATQELMKAVPDLDYKSANAKVLTWVSVTGDRDVAKWLEDNTAEVEKRIADEKASRTKDEIAKLLSALPQEKRSEILRGLQ
eukprot:TRINITY_DN4212_c0_g1_i3.p1 TRINITY_DN4212_c0_g1~~TRINITY_DN4212_c0_g1_i3.p1  ORF type:complete len:2077 (+),score=502.62 TRINITY_DN4212_c0_g1_i3:244-6231(+)